MASPAHAPQTILVVDDDIKLTFLLREFVEQFGYEVEVAHSGAEAEAIVRDGAVVDLLLTDITIKHGFNGFELAKRIRAILPTVPVLYVSGNADYSTAEMGLVRAPILLKPVQYDTLKEAIVLALQG